MRLKTYVADTDYWGSGELGALSKIILLILSLFFYVRNHESVYIFY